MGNLEEKCLRFVLHYYQKNKLDTQKALKDFKDKHQISECNKISHVFGGYLPVLPPQYS